jgi:hypothetical protein
MDKSKTLQQQQSEFAKALGHLITYAFTLGYELTLGDTYPGKHKHSPKGYHPLGLAIDLNLFKDGKYLTKTSDHKPLGAYWKVLGGTWGGDWQDGNHYSWNEGKGK